MPYVPFHDRFPEIAQRETRSVTVLRKNDFGLPTGDYGFLEMFCDEPGCDCRRVFFYVVSSRRMDLEAVIAYGWETREFYAQWLRSGNARDIADLQGPILNLFSPQSRLAPALLDLFEKVLLRDRAYIDRVKEHYRIFREEIDRKRPGTGSRSKRKPRKP
jgi:hypothetical protein